MEKILRASKENCIFLQIDMQSAIVEPILYEKQVLHNACRLIKISNVMDILLIAIMIKPERTGYTRESLRELFHDGVKQFPKLSISAMKDDRIRQELESLLPSRHIVVIWGYQLHYCVMSTMLDLQLAGF